MSIPIEQCDSTRVTGRPIHRWFQFLLLDLKRGGGFWMAPGVVVIAWLVLRNALTPGVALWPEITWTISNLAIPLTLLAVGVGAYAGGRERRGAIGELTATGAVVAWKRYLSLTVSILFWALGLYMIIALALIGYGAARATWGGPEIGVLVVPIPIMVLGSAFGVLTGRIAGGKTAPIIAIAAFMLVFTVLPSASQDIRPLGVFSLNTWYRPIVENAPDRPVSAWVQVAWGLGLTGLLLGTSIRMESRVRLAGILAVLSALATIGSGYQIMGAGAVSSNTSSIRRALMDVPEGGVCDESGVIRVCVHPAYERLLPTLSADVHAFLGPIAGLDGVVDRVYISGGNEDGGGWEQGNGAAMSLDLSMRESPRALISQRLWPFSFMLSQERANPAQYVVMTALARRIGVDEWPEYFHHVPENAAALNDEIGRFAALSPEEQRSWLEVNWDDLSYGRMMLKDLP